MARKPLDARIAIIGAGSAGLAAAWYLKKLGYRDVLVLEKLPRVGGLCKTITDGYQTFDLGGNFITPAYRETREIAKSVGAETYRGKDYGLAYVGEKDGKKTLEYGELRDYVNTDPKTGKKHSIWKMARASIRFALLRHRARKWVDEPTFANINANDQDLCVPFEAWLDRNDLGCLKRMFEIPIAMMGYGFLDEIATPYVLKYMEQKTYWVMILKGLPVLSDLTPWPKRFTLGFQRMWEMVSWKLNVRLEVTISEIRRDHPGDRPIEITLEHPDRLSHGRGNREVKHYFDRLIVACPLSTEVLLDELQLDLNADEVALFDKIDTFSYCQTTFHAVKVENGEERPFELKMPVIPVLPFTRASIGYPWVVVQVWPKDSGLLQFYSRIHKDDWVPLERFWLSLPDEMDLDQEDKSRDVVLERARIILELMDGAEAGATKPELKRWLTFHRWPYFGHVTPEEMKGGFYQQLDQLQGEKATYYAGGATTFELVESVVRSSKYVVEKLDAELRNDPAFAG
jgi:hypothetical protein